MPDKEEQLIATFEPSELLLLASSSNNHLLVEFPILASALSQIFPYLLLMDTFLELTTWTNDDPYQNFLLVVIFLGVVMYWHLVSMLILPIFIALLFSSLVWSISSIIYDSKYHEKPTIDEVLHVLHNITVRFEMLLRPVQHIPFKLTNYIKIFLMAGLFTPVHVLILKTIITPQKYVWFFGLFVLTYHSPWSFTIRRLLWRSVYLRIIAVYITGLDIKLTRNKDGSATTQSVLQSPTLSDTEESSTSIQLLSDFKILKKSIVSPTQLKQVVLFEVLENERRWFGLGWTNKVLPGERLNYSFSQLLNPVPSLLEDPEGTNFPFPTFENDLFKYDWNWVDTAWKLDLDFNEKHHSEGWVYYDSSWGKLRYSDGMSKYTRSRKWIRRAVLLIDKRETTYDE